jgi:hypothetical protein
MEVIMKIWRLWGDYNRYANFTSEPDFSLDEVRMFDGRPMASEWKVRKLNSMDANILPVGDVLGFGSRFLVNDTIRQIFTNLGITEIEYLRMDYKGTAYYLMNVLETLDCLDREKSDALYSPTTKDRILFVKRYCFYEDRIGDKMIFRLKDEPLRMAFVNETVVSALKKAGIKGFCYELVYDGVDDPRRKVSIDGVLSIEY